jgi:hypothetical protein
MRQSTVKLRVVPEAKITYLYHASFKYRLLVQYGVDVAAGSLAGDCNGKTGVCEEWWSAAAVEDVPEGSDLFTS